MQLRHRSTTTSRESDLFLVVTAADRDTPASDGFLVTTLDPDRGLTGGSVGCVDSSVRPEPSVMSLYSEDATVTRSSTWIDQSVCIEPKR